MILELAFIVSCFAHPVGYSYGRASWYGREWEHGKHRGRMANGSQFNRHRLTAASYAFPLGTVLEVLNLRNGKRTEVVVTDRGPARRLNRLLDLSEGAASKLGFQRDGVANISVFVKKFVPNS